MCAHVHMHALLCSTDSYLVVYLCRPSHRHARAKVAGCAVGSLSVVCDPLVVALCQLQFRSRPTFKWLTKVAPNSDFSNLSCLSSADSRYTLDTFGQAAYPESSAHGAGWKP